MGPIEYSIVILYAGLRPKVTLSLVRGYIFSDVSIIISLLIVVSIDQFWLKFTNDTKYLALLCHYIFELIHDQLPLAVPCYDLVPVTKFTLGHVNADFGHPRLPWLDGRWVQDLRTYSPWYSWPTITSDSYFMRASCSPQSELRIGLKDWLRITPSRPVVLPIVSRV